MGLQDLHGTASLAWDSKTSARQVDKNPTLNSAPARSLLKRGPGLGSLGPVLDRARPILDFILGTVGVFSDPCRLQEPNMEGSSRHSEPELLFSSILGSAPSAQEGSRCSGSSVFTWTTSGK